MRPCTPKFRLISRAFQKKCSRSLLNRSLWSSPLPKLNPSLLKRQSSKLRRLILRRRARTDPRRSTMWLKTASREVVAALAATTGPVAMVSEAVVVPTITTGALARMPMASFRRLVRRKRDPSAAEVAAIAVNAAEAISAVSVTALEAASDPKMRELLSLPPQPKDPLNSSESLYLTKRSG